MPPRKWSHLPRLGERDLIVVAFACVSKPGKPDAKAALGISFGKRCSVVGISMGHEVPAGMAQRMDVAAYIAISCALRFAPTTHNLYIATNSPSAIADLNRALEQHEWENDIIGIDDASAPAWPESLSPDKTTRCAHAGTMRSILEGIQQRKARGTLVKIVPLEHVYQRAHRAQAEGLAWASLVGEPVMFKEEHPTLRPQGEGYADLVKGAEVAKKGEKEGELSAKTEGDGVEEAKSLGAAPSTDASNEKVAAKEQNDAHASKAEEDSLGGSRPIKPLPRRSRRSSPSSHDSMTT